MRLAPWIFVVIVLAVAPRLEASPPSDTLIAALISVESGGDDQAIGDKHLRNRAYGCLQIRQPVCDDINRWYGTKLRAEECLGNRDLSIKVCKLYIHRYATAERLGKEPSDEDKARIWNGGPNGYNKASTASYWEKVRATLRN